MKEHDLQASIHQYLLLKGILHFETDVMAGLQFFSHTDCRRFSFINHHKKLGYLKGQPDLVLVFPGKVVFVELKTGTGRQREEQKDFEKNVKALNIDYYIWRSLDDAMEFLKG